MSAPQINLALQRQKKILRSHEQAKGYLLDLIDERLVPLARARGGRITVDAAHEVLDDILAEDVELGYPEHRFNRKFLGALFRHRDHWVNTGDRKPTTRAERNYSKVTVWRLDESKLQRED